MIKRLNEFYSLDEKKYYLFIPGTTHYDENKFGNPVYVPDFYYLDEKFNRFLGNRNTKDVEEYVKKLNKKGLDVFVGPHSPEKEDQNGDFIPYQDPNLKGVWKRPTNVEVEIYNNILEEQKQTKKLA